VSVRLTKIPEGVELRVGTTASVFIMNEQDNIPSRLIKTLP